MKRVSLFIPCFIDTIYPRVGVATLRLLEKLGYEVVYPKSQTCCGQPLYNSGFKDEAKVLAQKFYEEFSEFDYIVAPSASCISMVKIHYKDLLPKKQFERLSKKSFEISEFLHDEVKLGSLDISFPHTVSLHKSCHGLRELELGVSSERNLPYSNKVENLLKLVKDIKIVEMEKADECCGFGGTFSVNEADISIKMGEDKLKNFHNTKAEYLIGYDNSCLMHLSSINPGVKMLHIVEILAGMADADL